MSHRSSRSALALALLTGGVLLLVLGLLIPSALAAPDVFISLEPRVGTAQDTFVLEVQISGDGATELGKPIFTENKNFRITLSGTTIGLQVVNGRPSNSTTYRYSIYPSSDLEPGDYAIGEGYLLAGTEKVALQIPEVTITKTTSPSGSSDYGIEFIQKVGRDTPYVGEQILYEAQIISHNTLSQAALDDLEFEGFYRESFGKGKERLRSTAGDNAVVYTVREALFPSQAGTIEIPQRAMTAQLRVKRRGTTPPPRRGMWDPLMGSFPDLLDFDLLGETIEKRFIAPSVAVEVKPLPPAPQAGLTYIPVGTVSIASSTDKKLLKEGESLTFTVELYGDANLRPYELPSIADNSNFRSYPDKPTLQIFVEDGKIKFKKKFIMALLPLKSGELELPEISVVTFDPSEERYRILKTAPRTINIIAGLGVANQSATPPATTTTDTPSIRTEVRSLGEDLLAQHEGAETTAPRKELSSTVFGIALFGPPLFVLLLFYLWQHASRSLTSPEKLRQRTAYQQALHSLSDHKLSTVSSIKTKESAESLLRIIKTFVRDRYLLANVALTTDDIILELEQRFPNRELLLPLKQLLRQLEQVVYSGRPPASEESIAEESSLKDILTQLDKME